TATDVYSLGVLLYELLSGSRPYTLGGLSPAAAERLVCHGDSPRPSDVPLLPKAMRKQLRGDLDTIVLKAMEKDSARRYPSVRDFDDDLQRSAQGQPIAARRATPFYRWRKLVARHKTASVMACVACLALAGSLMFQRRQARSAELRVGQVQVLANAAIGGLTE